MNKQPGAQFEILVDGKPRSYRNTKSGAMDAAQEPTAAQLTAPSHSWRRYGSLLVAPWEYLF
jgi:hypothetical protein